MTATKSLPDLGCVNLYFGGNNHLLSSVDVETQCRTVAAYINGDRGTHNNRQVYVAVAARKTAEQRDVILYKLLAQHLFNALVGELTAATGELAKHDTLAAFQHAIHSQDVELTVDVVHRLSHLFDEQYDVAPQRGISLCAEIRREGADVAADKYTAGTAFNILRMCRQLITGHCTHQQVAHQGAALVGAAFGQKRAHRAVYAHNACTRTEAVQRGDVKEADLDKSLRRLLVARFELGDFDSDDLNPWTKIPESVVACDAHKQLALDMARKSIVMLQNKQQILPLKKNQKIAVLGANAIDSVMMWGNYSGYATRTITAMEGIQQFAPQAKFVSGCGLTRNEAFESRFDELKTPLDTKGMQATYYNNTELKGTPAATANLTAPIMMSNGGNTVFAPGVNLENFSARLDATFTPTHDETVIFNINGDDKVRLLVNGDTIVDIWRVRQRIQGAQKEMAVKAGQSYRIQIDYVQEGGFAFLGFDIQHKVAPTHQELLAQIGDAETIIFVGGISPKLEGEEMRVDEEGFKGGDRTSIELPKAQRETLAMLHQAGKKVIFVNCSGSAMGLLPELESCDAIIQAWYGGELGGQALAEVIFGDYNPSGKLPITFYKSTNDLPDFLDYKMTNRTYRYFTGEPLFPFGFGLSYTSFEIGKPEYKNDQVQVSIKNTGTTAGLETVQVYIRNIADVEGPLKTLRAYQQVELVPSEVKTISIDLPRSSFEGWDAQTNTMRVVPGKYELMVGNSSADQDQKKITINLK